MDELVKSKEIYVSLDPKLTQESSAFDFKNHYGYGLVENDKIIHFKSAISSSYWYLGKMTTCFFFKS